MRLKYKSKIMEAIHEDALGLFEVGAITEEEMREFDRACLKPETQPVNEQLEMSN